MSSIVKRQTIGAPVSRGPDADRIELAVRELPPSRWDQETFITPRNSYLRRYAIGECSVIVTREDGKWHLSIAHRRRLPTWDEISVARYRVLPDAVTMGMILPPRSEYVNLHQFCFQLHEMGG